MKNVKKCSIPLYILDIVCVHKGSPNFGIILYYKNKTTKEKRNLLKINGVDKLLEIDAEWILKQKIIPSKIEYKTLID